MGRRRVERRRDERGLVLPTRLMVFSISAVVVAGLAFVATQPDNGPDVASPAALSEPKPTPTAVTSTPVTPSATPRSTKPAVRRGAVYVVVFNNSNVKGLAGKTATRAQRAGWNVVATDNWYGTVDSTAVYYPPRLKAAAEELGFDLGIKRIKPSQEPMQFDRLTVILTDDYHG